MRAIVRWAIRDAEEVVAIRLAIGPSPRRIEVPEEARPGQGRALCDGSDAVLLAYGPVLLHEALAASELLAGRGIGLAVVNMPWLNRLDPEWLPRVADYERIVVVEDHSPVGGLGDALRRGLPGRQIDVFGVEGWPACGTPTEALRAHELDAASLARRIAALLSQGG
jgi:transketolase